MYIYIFGGANGRSDLLLLPDADVTEAASSNSLPIPLAETWDIHSGMIVSISLSVSWLVSSNWDNEGGGLAAGAVLQKATLRCDRYAAHRLKTDVFISLGAPHRIRASTCASKMKLNPSYRHQSLSSAIPEKRYEILSRIHLYFQLVYDEQLQTIIPSTESVVSFPGFWILVIELPSVWLPIELNPKSISTSISF